MPGLYDRIRDTWTISSPTTLAVSSTFTVTGTAASGYETFAARYAANEGNIPVAIVSQTANQWMICWCTYNPTGSTPNLLRIDTVIFSTSGDSSVTFSPATMDVFVTASSRAVPGIREQNVFTAANFFLSSNASGDFPVTVRNSSQSAVTTKYVGIRFQGVDTVGATKYAGSVYAQPEDSNYVASSLRFATRTSDAVNDRMTILGNGNVGIGTTAPDKTLVVNGGVKAIGWGAATAGNLFFGSGDQAQIYGDASVMAFYTAGAERVRIDNTGRLGVGLSSPSGDIHTYSTTSFRPQINADHAGTTAASAGYLILDRSRGSLATRAAVTSGDYLGTLMFRGHDGANFQNSSWIFGAVDAAVSTGIVPSALIFTTTPAAGGSTERMRITSAGTVGINTNNPSTLFHIQETSQFSLGLTARTSSPQTAILNHPVALFENSNATAGNGLGIRFRIADTSGTLQVAGGVGAIAEAKTASSVSGGLYFYTGSSERMRITSGGLVGINVTPTTSRFHVQCGAVSASTVGVYFEKPRNASFSQRYVWEDCGGLTSDVDGAYWRGFALSGIAGGITDPTGGATLYPRTTFYFEYNTAAAPTTRRFVYELGGDTATSRHDVVFRSGNTDRLNITGAGNALFSGSVGVNTATLSARLHVEDANTTGVGVFVKNTSTAQNFMGGIGLGNSATANGFNVTIGTAVRDADTTDSYFAINKTNITTNTFVATLAYHDLTDNFWAFHTAGSERVRIGQSGILGIGISAFPLNTTTRLYVSNDVTLFGPNRFIGWNLDYSGATPNWTYTANGYAFALRENNGGKLQLYTTANNTGGIGAVASPGVLMTFDATATAPGNVGIGTSSPNRRLEVTETGTNIPMRVGNAQGNFDFGGADGTNVYIDSRTWGTGFQVGGTTRMSIDTSGNVGIGATPVASTRLTAQTPNLTTALNDTQRIARFISAIVNAVPSVTNVSNLDLTTRRHTAGTDWVGTNVRLQRVVDVTGAGFVDFGVDGVSSSSGLGFGTGSTTHMRMSNGGDWAINSGNHYAKLHINAADSALGLLVSGSARGIRLVNNTGDGIIEGVDQTGTASYQPLAIGGSALSFTISGSLASRITSAGQFLMGHSASVESITGVATAKLQVSGTDGTSAAAVYRYSADTNGPMFILSKSRGSVGASAAVSAGDELGAIHFAGAGATGFHRAASIQGIADTGVTGAADMPGRLQFLTSADGSATPTERLRITSTGDVVLMNDAGARDVSSIGFRGIPSNERSANYTLALTDAGKAVVKMITTAMTVTVPDNVTVPFPIGTTIMIDNSHPTAYSTTANIVTITPAADVGIVGAGAVKDQTTGTLPRFKNKTMNWPMQASLRKIRNKGSAVTLTTNPNGSSLSTTVTITMPSTNPYQPNDFIIIAGGTNTAYNGTHRVLTVSGLTLTYQLAAAPGGATGTYTATPADLWVITGDYGNSTTA